MCVCVWVWCVCGMWCERESQPAGCSILSEWPAGKGWFVLITPVSLPLVCMYVCGVVWCVSVVCVVSVVCLWCVWCLWCGVWCGVCLMGSDETLDGGSSMEMLPHELASTCLFLR